MAYDSATGNLLWKFQAGAGVNARRHYTNKKKAAGWRPSSKFRVTG